MIRSIALLLLLALTLAACQGAPAFPGGPAAESPTPVGALTSPDAADAGATGDSAPATTPSGDSAAKPAGDSAAPPESPTPVGALPSPGAADAGATGDSTEVTTPSGDGDSAPLTTPSGDSAAKPAGDSGSPFPLREGGGGVGSSLRQLTQGGCCSAPFWAPQSGRAPHGGQAPGQARVLFLDKPSAEQPAGFWGVPLAGGAVELYTERLGVLSPDGQLVAYPQGGRVVIERLADGQTFSLANGGRAVSFSPDSAWVAWTGGQGGPPFDSGLRQVWVARPDGSGAHKVFEQVNGGLAGWFPDGRMLVSGNLSAPESGQAYWILDWQAQDGLRLAELARAERLRSALLSPDGAWLAYTVAFTADPAAHGLWVTSTAGGQPRRLEMFGAYRWRPGGGLLVVPLDAAAVQGSVASHRLWEIDPSSGQAAPLTDPTLTPFKIAQGEWIVSPDGASVVFLSAEDGNLWALDLP